MASYPCVITVLLFFYRVLGARRAFEVSIPSCFVMCEVRIVVSICVGVNNFYGLRLFNGRVMVCASYATYSYRSGSGSGGPCGDALLFVRFDLSNFFMYGCERVSISFLLLAVLCPWGCGFIRCPISMGYMGLAGQGAEARV